MSEHEHTEPEPDERGDETNDVDDAAEVPEPEHEEGNTPAA
jgi:hypothetical protein